MRPAWAAAWPSTVTVLDPVRTWLEPAFERRRGDQPPESRAS
ncbi:hypothetical protein [Cyanobium sp. PCC 7001]|nr:hypothetical protein [Cyanobium sp. PCC 7001]